MVAIQKGIPPEAIRSAADLYLSALWEKFRPVLGNDERAISVVESSIKPNNCFSAMEDHQLIGVLAIQTTKQHFLNPGLMDLKTHYGIAGAIAKGIALQLLQYKPRHGELYVEGVAVAEFARGKGVGTKLFEAMTNYARGQAYRTISLEVIDTNKRALTLYERLGFAIKKRSKIWPLNKIIGWPFNESILMELTVDVNPAT